MIDHRTPQKQCSDVVETVCCSQNFLHAYQNGHQNQHKTTPRLRLFCVCIWCLRRVIEKVCDMSVCSSLSLSLGRRLLARGKINTFYLCVSGVACGCSFSLVLEPLRGQLVRAFSLIFVSRQSCLPALFQQHSPIE